MEASGHYSVSLIAGLHDYKTYRAVIIMMVIIHHSFF